MKTGALSLTLSLLFWAGAAFADTHQLVIGVTTPLTGNAQASGEDIKNFLLFANDELADGKVKFIFEDDRCDVKSGVTAAERLTKIEGLKYIIAGSCSGPLIAASSVFKKAGATVLSTYASASAVSNLGEHVFRTALSDAEGVALLTSLIAKKHKRLGILTELTSFAQSMLDDLKSSPDSNLLELVEETFETSATDVRAQLLKLQRQKSEALFVNVQTEATFITVVKQVRQMGLSMPVYGMYFPGIPLVISALGPHAEGIRFVDTPGAEDLARNDSTGLYKKFVARFGEPKSYMIGFFTTLEGFRALREAMLSGKDVREYLRTTTFKGMWGDWKFNKRQEAMGYSFVAKEIRAGKVTWLGF